jgi:hypothetical protein
LEDGHLTLTGLGPSQAAVDTTQAALDSLELPGLQLDVTLEVDPTAAAGDG